MRSSNPALQLEAFDGKRWSSVSGATMTIQGVVIKSFLLLSVVLLAAAWTWNAFFAAGQVAAVQGWMMLGVFGGFGIALLTVFKPAWAFWTTPVYAAFQGLFIGGISSILEVQFPGIAIQAVSLTFGTLAVMLTIYGTGLIQVTDRFRIGVVAATGGIALFYLVTIVLSFFGVSVPFVFEGGTFGVLFSLFVVGIAALNLLLDFDVIERGVSSGLPRSMEWYCSFALMVTLVWLYIEFLRLLSKLRER
jgi:uncharacterized YccA/Bax inhibitor family protein